MAKDIYDKLKAVGDLFKQYWLLGVLIGSLSISGNIFQAYSAPPAKKEIPYTDKCSTQCIEDIKKLKRWHE